MITSKNNDRIKNIKKLLASKKARDEQGLFVVEGEKMVLEAPSELIHKIYITEERSRELRESLPKDRDVETVAEDVMKAVSDTVTPQGVAALVRKPLDMSERFIEDVKKRDDLLVVLLDGIRDPGNMGTIIRTAEAAGVDYVIMSDDSVDVYSPKVVRSTMGSIFRVKILTADIAESIHLLLNEDTEVYATAPDAKAVFDTIAYGKRKAFIIGNEAAGISAEILAMDIKKIRIPMHGEVESLNAAVSLAVILYGSR